MTINEVEIRQAENAEVTNGTVSEYNIKIKETTRKCVIDDEETDVKTAWIGGSLNVEVNGNIIKHNFAYLDTIRHKKNGDENKSFASIISALGFDVAFDAEAKKLTYTESEDGYLVPKIEGKITWVDEKDNVTKEITVSKNKITVDGVDKNVSLTPTRVKVTSKLSYKSALNNDGSDLTFYNELPVSFISRSKAESEDSAIFSVEGVVKEITNELSATTATATGRYLVDLIVPNFFGVDIFTLTMLDKWVNNIDGEDVEITKEMFYEPNNADSFCKVGDTVKLSGDIEAHSFGAVTTNSSAKKSFGGGAQSVKQGFTKVEWTIKAGDLVEDGDKYDVDLIAKAIEERDVALDNEYKRLVEYEKNKAKNTTTTTKSPSQAKGGATPFGNTNTAPKANPFGGGAKANPFAK